MELLVLKLGGRAAEDEALTAALFDELRELEADGMKSLVVHGGGAVISEIQTRLGLEPRFVDGLRQTSSEEMPVVDMVLAGKVNKSLVRLAWSRGLSAWGLCGADAGLMTAESHCNDRTGHVVSMRAEPLKLLLNADHLPILAPPAADSEGGAVNVNADEAALAVAVALKVSGLLFLSDVPGVLENDVPLDLLDPAAIEEKIAAGIVKGGMIPKVQAAAAALSHGVGSVIIGDYTEAGDLKDLLEERRGTHIRPGVQSS